MNEVMMQRDTMLGRATIGDQLRRHAQHIPEKPAIVFYHPSGERQVQVDHREVGGSGGLGVVWEAPRELASERVEVGWLCVPRLADGVLYSLERCG